MKILSQTINLFTLIFSGFVIGYIVGLNPTISTLAGDRRETFEARVSAYCPAKCCCGKYADGVTASGHRIQPGDKFCAAPKSIPFGTMIDIPGYGRVPVLDRGGAIKEGRLDVYFDDADGKSGHERALIWGVRNLQVKIAR